MLSYIGTGLPVLRPSQQCFSYVGTSLPGLNRHYISKQKSFTENDWKTKWRISTIKITKIGSDDL